MVNVRSRSSTRCKATTRVKFFQGSGSSPREARRGCPKEFFEKLVAGTIGIRGHSGCLIIRHGPDGSIRPPAFRLYDLRHTSRHCSWPRTRRSPTSARSSATRIPRRRSATTRAGSRTRDGAGWISSIASARPSLRLRRPFPVRFGTRFGTKRPQKAKSGTPAIPKCPIRLVGRQGLEPWTR